MEEQTIKILNKFAASFGLLVLGLLVFFAAYIVYQFKFLDQQNINQITVSGEGKVYVKPDIALVNLGVTTTGLTTADVIKKNTEKMNAVIKAVKDAGVEEKDIKTTNYSLSPLYNYTEAAGRVFQGYTLDQSIEVKIRDFAKVGDILQQAVAKGANLTNNLQFTIENPEQFKQEARANAVEQAKEKAKNLAEASGIVLGRLVNINESFYPYPLYERAIGLGGGVMESAPSIQSGQTEITVTVNLTYRVK